MKYENENNHEGSKSKLYLAIGRSPSKENELPNVKKNLLIAVGQESESKDKRQSGQAVNTPLNVVDGRSSVGKSPFFDAVLQ